MTYKPPVYSERRIAMNKNADEIIALLLEISKVSQRLARNIALLEIKKAQKETPIEIQ